MLDRVERAVSRMKLDIIGHCVNLYWMDTAVLTDTAVFDAACRILPRWRRDRVDYYLRESDKRLSAGAGLLLLRGLADRKINGQDAAVAYGQYGKPWMPEYPEIQFNLSHAGNMAVAVFADTDVGCDIERMGQADMALAKKFFCADEYACLARLQDGEARNTAFYRLWTLKESFVKATGLGLAKMPLDAFEVTLMPDGAARVGQQTDQAAYGFWGRHDAGMCLGVCVRSVCR